MLLINPSLENKDLVHFKVNTLVALFDPSSEEKGTDNFCELLANKVL